MSKTKRLIFSLILVAACVLLVIAGSIFFEEKNSAFISVGFVIIALVVMFLSFEQKEKTSIYISLVATLTAFSVVGRIIFSVIPGFKPVAAITILTGVYLGYQAGFLCGSLSAVISNFYFGQGGWTPFQMLGWGLIGLFAGLLARYLKKTWAMAIFSAICGLFFSITMEVWNVIFVDNYFNFARFYLTFGLALPSTAEYAISNVIFIVLLNKPFGSVLKRITTKYQLK